MGLAIHDQRQYPIRPAQRLEAPDFLVDVRALGRCRRAQHEQARRLRKRSVDRVPERVRCRQIVPVPENRTQFRWHWAKAGGTANQVPRNSIGLQRRVHPSAPRAILMAIRQKCFEFGSNGCGADRRLECRYRHKTLLDYVQKISCLADIARSRLRIKKLQPLSSP